MSSAECSTLRVCTKCLQSKDPSEFCINRRGADGLRPDCRSCQSKHHKAYYLRTRVLKGHTFQGHDLSGQRFGRLTVLSLAGKDRQGKPVWNCKCDCGNEAKVRSKSLNAGHVRSCGCLARENSRRAIKIAIGAIRLPYGVSAARCLITRYKWEAVRRGFGWHLTDEEALALTQQPCAYCGEEPRQVATANKGFGCLLYNGIDRADPNFGYTRENSKPCCKACNFAKHTMTVPQFINWIDRVHKHLLGGQHG